VQLRSIGTSTVTVGLARPPADAAAPNIAMGDGASERVSERVIEPSVRPLTRADLAGEWTHKGSILTRCIDRYTGAYVGDDSITMHTTWLITASGTIASDSYGVHNGAPFVESAIGRIRLAGNILHIRMRGGARTKYVMRGWLPNPAVTVLKLNGPWHGDIPQEVLENPDEGWSCDQSWFRKA